MPKRKSQSVVDEDKAQLVQRNSAPNYVIVPLSLQAKVGSLLVHVEEMISPKGHQFDKHAIESLLTDFEVQEFLAKLGRLGLLPQKR